MQPAAPETSICPGCGHALEETSGGGLGCMVCLLRVAIGGEDEVSQAASAGSTSKPPEDEERFGSYEIERHPDGSLYELGRGAMGVTYRAIDTSLQRKVALKIVNTGNAGRSAEARERFMREARMAAVLRHENIATVFQFGIREETGQCFYAMELIEGETLEERVHRGGPLGVRTTIYIAQQVTAALGAAEKRGLVHRDLKPANLMLVSPDGETLGAAGNNEKPVVKIIDFGLAKALNAPIDSMSLTRGGFVGTPAFASPEQFEHSALDVRSDIYSLGETLWFALTGKTPYAGHSMEEIHRAQQLNALPTEQLKAAHVPHCLRSLLESMLALEPAARPGTQDLAARLWHCAAEAGGVRRTRLALVAALILILGASAFFISRSQRIHPAAAGSASNPIVPHKSIAVLPFENLSKDKVDAFLADGVQDDVLTKLAKIADLKVISRTSVMQYRGKQDLRQIGEALGVSHVLHGTVRRSNGKVHINAQLVDARTDTHVWAEEYDRDMNEVFAIEAEVAQSIANQLRTRVSPREKLAMQERLTSDLVAFDLYTRAKQLVLTASGRSTGRTDLLEAVDLLKQAVSRDPLFLQAYCQLASAHDHLYVLGFDHTPARLALAEAAIQAAFRLRPDAGEAHLARAENLYRGYRDYGGALAELEVARQSLPNDAPVIQLLGFIQRRQGRWEEATQNMERAVELDPRNTYTLQQMAWQYVFVRRYAEAKALLARVLAIEPNRVDTKVFLASVDFHWKADIKHFRQTIDSIRTTNPSALPAIADAWLTCALAEREPQAAASAIVAVGEDAFGDDTVQFSRTFVEGLVARMMKDESKARSAFITARTEQEKIVRAQPNYGPPFCVLGLIDAALGRKEDALREGRRAVELVPVEQDAINGARMIKYLAMIAAWSGDKDLACEQLATAVRYPTSPSYGELKLLPFWDALRGDPCFEQIVASLTPKEAKPLSESNTSPSQAPALLEKRIAVLPFENLSAEKDDAFFTAGFQDDVLTTLGKIKELQVIGRASFMGYRAATVDGKLRDIGRTLRVSHVLEGSVRRSSNRVVINVALLDTRDDRQVWSERYERTLTDTLSLQGELAIEIARALHANLTLAEESNLAVKPTENPDAYVLYLRARELELRFAPSEADYEAAIKLYQQAVDLDPEFALARARLSIAISGLTQGNDPSRKTRARAEAEEALRLRPRLGEARLAIAYCYFFWEKDYDSALIELSRVAELMPSSAEVPFTAAFIYKWQNKFRQRIAALERATILDPRDTNVLNRLYMTFRWVRNWPEALRTRDQAKSLLPLNDRGKYLSYGRAWDEFRMAGNIDSLKKLITDPLSGLGPEDLNLVRYQIAVLERDYPAAERFLGEVPSKVFESFYWKHPKSVEEASLAVARGADQTTVERRVESARREIETLLSAPFRLSTRVDELHYNLGLIYAFIGRKEDAIREGRLGVELSTGPMEKNEASAALALIYARLGESDEAVQMIEHLLTVPAELHPSEMHAMTLTELKCRWQWDPLRSNARFQKILAGPEPTTIY